MSETEKPAMAAPGDLAPGRSAGAISSGAISLDWALGGGFPCGRMTELYGPEASGKTTIALHAAAEAQRRGGTAAFLDADHALDTNYAQALGVTPERLLLSRPECGEQALEMALQLAASRAVEMVVVDSAAALAPRLELEGGPAENSTGMQQRMLEQGLRKLAAAAARTGCCLLFVNQLRGRGPAGGMETTAGGPSLRLHAALRAEVRPVERIEGGIRVRVRVVKNRLAPPYREASFMIRYGSGIAREEDLLACAARCGLTSPDADPASRKALQRATRRALGLVTRD